uniref:4-hydroxy-3-methylbut-2-enyl diphosphate reductase n=2 Tax=Viridiplantae TaxID=33090 RepID=A0A7S3XEL5_9CHLO
MFEKAMMTKFGPENLNEHFMLLDTICDATQERQDAMYDLVKEDVDMMIVVGGFNSSNTSHLQEIAEHANIKSFWVDQAGRIDVENNSLDHRTSWGELQSTKDWLKPGPLKVGVTSGASTPDKVVEDVLDAMFQIKAATA